METFITSNKDGEEIKEASSLMFEKGEIEGTPLEWVERESDTIVVLGRFKIEGGFENRGEAKEWVKANQLNVALKMMAILIPGEVTAQLAIRDSFNQNTER